MKRLIPFVFLLTLLAGCAGMEPTPGNASNETSDIVWVDQWDSATATVGYGQGNDTLFTFTYDLDTFDQTDFGAYSDWQLVCYLIHADGAYAEAPSDLLFTRFLERPGDLLKALALLDSAPYGEKYPHIEGIVAGPGYSAANTAWREDREDFQQILDTFQPETDAEQAVLDKIRAAYQSASSDMEFPPIETEFSLVIPGNRQPLTLGPQEGTFPWGYDLEGELVYTGPADTYGTAYEWNCGSILLAYFVFPDDGTEYLYKLTTETPYDHSGAPCTARGLYCGYNAEHLHRVYSHAVEWGSGTDGGYDTCYVYQPPEAYTKFITFYLKEGTVARIEMADLMDGRLLDE